MELKMTPTMKQKLLSGGDLSQYMKDEQGKPSFNKTFNCWNKKPNYTSKETLINYIKILEMQNEYLKDNLNYFLTKKI